MEASNPKDPLSLHRSEVLWATRMDRYCQMKVLNLKVLPNRPGLLRSGLELRKSLDCHP
jgi:hypothetical protein